MLTNDSKARFWEFREFLERSLPDYMIPTGIEVMDLLPVNANGKVDRAALPKPTTFRPQLKQPHEAPSGEVQCHLVSIWEEVLGINDLGVDDNFFELGGHSITANAMLNRVEKKFQVRMSVSSVFGNPTIRLFSELLKEQS